MHGPVARDVGAFGDKSIQHFVGTVNNQPCTSAPVCSHATELPNALFGFKALTSAKKNLVCMVC